MSRKHKKHRNAGSTPGTPGPLPAPRPASPAAAGSPKTASASSAIPNAPADSQGTSWQLIFLIIVMALGILGVVAKSLGLF